jgi:hypothetical protein
VCASGCQRKRRSSRPPAGARGADGARGQPRSQVLRLDEDRRRDPRGRGSLLSTDFQLGTPERDALLVAGEWQAEVLMDLLEAEYRGVAASWVGA